MLARDICRPPSFKASYNKNDDPPTFVFPNKSDVDLTTKHSGNLELLNQVPNLLKMNSNQMSNQVFETTESLLASNVPVMKRVLLIESRRTQNNYDFEGTSANSRLYHLIENRQKQIKSLLYLEEIRRLKQIVLLSNPSNAIFNLRSPQGSIRNVSSSYSASSLFHGYSA